MTDTTTPGRYPGMSREAYEAIDAANQSTLKLFDRSAAHALQELQHPKDPTPSLLLGRAIHTSVLEPESFEAQYAQSPHKKTGVVYPKNTKEGRAEWAAWEAAHPEQEALKPDDWNACEAIRQELWRSPTVKELLGGKGFNEFSIVWEDEESGLTCKGQIDRLTTFGDWTVIVDLKSSLDPTRWSFERDFYKYGYHVQSAFYLDGMNALSPRERIFIIVAFEKNPPYGVQVYQVSSAAVELGRATYRRYLEQLKEARREGKWPNYDTSLQIIDVPEWAHEKEANRG
jgi:hypothetical protein